MVLRSQGFSASPILTRLLWRPLLSTLRMRTGGEPPVEMSELAPVAAGLRGGQGGAQRGREAPVFNGQRPIGLAVDRGPRQRDAPLDVGRPDRDGLPIQQHGVIVVELVEHLPARGEQ